jgi:hypothetical protein
MKTVKVKFTETYTVKAQGGATYEKGSVHEFREDSARHFINRKVAVLTDAPAVAPEPEKPKVDLNETTITIYPRGYVEKHEDVIVVSEPKPEPIVVEFGDEPLISCVMPTWNRRDFIKASIDCWLKQTYENKELIIVDDGDDKVRDLIPRKKGIRYFKRDKKEITGTKRNSCNELSKGDIICHFDDDDWSAPDRLEHQLGLLRSTGKPITGYGTLYFWNVTEQKAMRYIAPIAGYVCGTTLMYLKSYWKDHPFLPKQEASDNSFVYPALKLIANSHDAGHMVARIHNHHTSGKSGIRGVVEREVLPAGFWANEELRIGSGNAK